MTGCRIRLRCWRGRALSLLCAVFACAGGAVAEAPAALEDRDPRRIPGRAALEDGLYSLAQRKFESFIKSSFFENKRALGTLYLVQALHAQKLHAEALKVIDEHARWTDGSPWQGDVVFWQALCLNDAGRAGERRAGYSGSRESEPRRSPGRARRPPRAICCSGSFRITP